MLLQRRGFAPESLTVIVNLHWVAILVAPLLLSWNDQPIDLATWATFGLFILYTTGLRSVASRRADRVTWPLLALIVLPALLLFAAILLSVSGDILAAGADKTSPARAATRVFCLALAVMAAVYLAQRERGQRRGRVEAERLLNEFRAAYAELAVHARHMSRRAVTDGLTQLYNHAYLHQRLDEELTRAERYRKHLSILMVDLDDFKAHNDTYGHVEGDRLLTEVAAVMKGAIRKGDAVCRYGGEEFAVIMPEADRQAALAVAERMCLLIHGIGGRGEGMAPRVTASIGAATYPDHGLTKMDLIAAADRALYRSKEAGKNRVT